MAPNDVGVGIVGLELVSLVQVGECVLVLTKPRLGIGPPGVGVGIVGLELEGLVIIDDGVLILT